jgi:hypothetical protein
MVKLYGNEIISKLADRSGVFYYALHNVLGQRADSKYEVITVE